MDTVYIPECPINNKTMTTERRPSNSADVVHFLCINFVFYSTYFCGLFARAREIARSAKATAKRVSKI